jgi:hypothetical protein
MGHIGLGIILTIVFGLVCLLLQVSNVARPNQFLETYKASRQRSYAGAFWCRVGRLPLPWLHMTGMPRFPSRRR